MSAVLTWLVRMCWREPDPSTTDVRLVDRVKHLTCQEHSAAHSTARRWAATPLPAGAVDPAIWIEHRDGANVVRTEEWPLR